MFAMNLEYRPTEESPKRAKTPLKSLLCLFVQGEQCNTPRLRCELAQRFLQQLKGRSDSSHSCQVALLTIVLVSPAHVGSMQGADCMHIMNLPKSAPETINKKVKLLTPF